MTAARVTELAEAYRAAVLAQHVAPFDTLPDRLAAAAALPVITEESTTMDEVIATIGAGSVEYSKDEAKVSIDDLIAELESFKADGATHVVGLSGNYRGASYVKLGSIGWLEDDEAGY